MNLQHFYDGQEFEAYEFLGAHRQENGYVFRTYAPAARAVSVIGAFNGWSDTPAHRVENGQFWEAFVPGAEAGQMYKFRIYRPDGSFIDHADPYAFFSELRPGTASVLYDRTAYAFRDGDWMWTRRDRKDAPLNIYELHLGSWRRTDDPQENARRVDDARNNGTGVDVSDGWMTYDEIADALLPYLQENGYNYVEFMPLNEYPADESWGYQSLGFFSATSRYGHPDGLKRMIDRFHQAGIGVLLDVVTVHFAGNDYGLWQYDGTPLYEYNNHAIDVSEWGSSNFNHSRGDICSFLNSASEFWLHDYHFDGLRFDAVGNLIYWDGNASRGVNKCAVDFLRRMNAGLKAIDRNVMLIAEDSTAYPNVTRPVAEGGLGFDYKWDMGWMNDTLNYMRTPASERPSQHHKLTFSMMYFYNDNYLLPLSHDEVVHGKASIIQKMSGDYEAKFPQARALYLYMFTHPGKKLNFMGNEIGQFREWDEKREQDWDLTKYPLHDAFHRYMTALHKLYLAHPALWARDYEPEGFSWVAADDTQHCVYVYRRLAAEETLLCLFNFSDQVQHHYYRPAGREQLTLLLNSAENTWGGSEPPMDGAVRAETSGLDILLPAYSARIYKEESWAAIERRREQEAAEKAAAKPARKSTAATKKPAAAKKAAAQKKTGTNSTGTKKA